MRPTCPLLTLTVVAAALLGCSAGSDDGGSTPAATDAPAVSETGAGPAMPSSTVDADVATTPFATAAAVCTDGFRTVELDHVVEVRQPESQFDANGAGVAVADLDGDDRLDIVLGNLDGPIRVFWNDGELAFTEQTLLSGRARSVQPVDIDADRDLDIILGPGFGPPLVLINEPVEGGRPQFRTSALPGVTAPAYSMIWSDPDHDGDLDGVVAAYDMEFGRLVGGEFISDAENGVWYLEQDGDAWKSTQLSVLSHALALTTVDVDADGDEDLIVGNDFAVADDVFVWNDGWERSADLFPVTAANTMSFDTGDVDGDGGQELYATDMAPFGDENEDFWATMAEMEHDPPGPQLAENVLLDLRATGYPNEAVASGVESSGWSWSGRLADLDHDGDLDLYVANGMHPSPLFPVFPNEELREPNLAFENTGDGRFVLADRWRLDTMAGTRGLALGDLDDDGDLDIVASTVESPALILVNELCTGDSVIVEPRVTDGNTSALGARVVVVTGQGRMERTIRSGTGYLSSDPAAAHVGLGDAEIEWIEIHWPDGERTVFDAPATGRIRVTR